MKIFVALGTASSAFRGHLTNGRHYHLLFAKLKKVYSYMSEMACCGVCFHRCRFVRCAERKRAKFHIKLDQWASEGNCLPKLTATKRADCQKERRANEQQLRYEHAHNAKRTEISSRALAHSTLAAGSANRLQWRIIWCAPLVYSIWMRRLQRPATQFIAIAKQNHIVSD